MGCKVENYHTPVLLKEVLHGLDECIRGDGKDQKIVVDATAGGMGHSAAIAKTLPGNGILVCIDRDSDALSLNKDRVGGQCKKIFVRGNFADISNILKAEKIDKVDAVLADLGVSSHQIDDPSRGFSYTKDGPLDMRMDKTQKRDANHVVNNYTLERLTEIIRDYGEERYARQIASAIVERRPIKTTAELTKIITEAVPGNYYKTGGHPAKRTFQAIRIEVNGELTNLETFIKDAVECLKPNGRIAIITFHSLEDRIVKQTFKDLSSSCLCPPKTPKCVCGHTKSINIVTKKPILPAEDEVKNNARSASAKLRIGGKI